MCKNIIIIIVHKKDKIIQQKRIATRSCTPEQSPAILASSLSLSHTIKYLKKYMRTFT